jgi:Flp pilus assembly protein TadG
VAIPVSERRRRRSGGNTLIESVFTLLPTFALIFGFIDFGLVIFRWSTLQNAVREGCRYAITFQTQTGQGQDASVGAMVQQYAFNMVKTTDSPQHIYVNYYSPSNLTTPIGSGGNIPGNVVEVAVKNISWAWLAPLSGGFTWPGLSTINTAPPINLNVFSSDILGGYPAGVTSVAR